MQQLAMHLNVKLVARPVHSAPAKTKTKRRKAISEINCLSFAFEIFIYKREINSTPCHPATAGSPTDKNIALPSTICGLVN